MYIYINICIYKFWRVWHEADRSKHILALPQFVVEGVVLRGAHRYPRPLSSARSKLLLLLLMVCLYHTSSLVFPLCRFYYSLESKIPFIFNHLDPLLRLSVNLSLNHFVTQPRRWKIDFDFYIVPFFSSFFFFKTSTAIADE